MTVGSAQTPVVIDNRLAAAVSKNKIVFGNKRSKRVSRIRFYAGESRGSIHVPEGDLGVIRAALKYIFFHHLINHATTAVLDNQIAFGCLLQERGNFFSVL